MVARVIDHRRAAAAFPALALVVADWRGREIRVYRPVVQLCERLGQIIGVDLLVRRVLELHLPAMRRRRGRGDEEELAGVGEGEVLVLRLDRGRLAEVDLDALAHDGLAVEGVADGDRGIVGVEGDDDAAEGL